ncbi:hypothetical protein CRE_29281 [Caenorhabditis remanei]|nr:hypothetical protein CRE_29281 [Caenorhabditis remanei]
MEITLSGPDDKCSKYTKRGNDFLVITHARIFQIKDEDWNIGELQIHGNIECHGKQTNATNYDFDCDGKTTEDYDGLNIMFSVTTRKQMLSGPIDYRYTESSMQLIKNGYLNPANLNKQKFHHDQHIHIKTVTITGLAKEGDRFSPSMIDCHDKFPQKLIADHGLYMYEGAGKYDNILQRMYFEPDSTGEYIVVTDTKLS